MASNNLVLVLSAGGRVGATGRHVTEDLLARGLPVRAWVRVDDHRSHALRALGAEVFVGDMYTMADVRRAMKDVQRLYFACPVVPRYLEVSTSFTVASRDAGVQTFVNISQQFASEDAESPQTYQHWLSEQVLTLSGVPTVFLRPTVFCEQVSRVSGFWIRRESKIALPWGTGRVPAVAARDVARVAAAVLANPGSHHGQSYGLTGPTPYTPQEMADIYTRELGRPIRYEDIAIDVWQTQLAAVGLDPHLIAHLTGVASRARRNFYDRPTDWVKKLTGREPMTLAEFVRTKRVELAPESPPTA